uniref:MADF domain-containing protein n=1 Tax=Steinernema glaseri TaxID=37863 RepID=A0A1I7ZMV0_9BILA
MDALTRLFFLQRRLHEAALLPYWCFHINILVVALVRTHLLSAVDYGMLAVDDILRMQNVEILTEGDEDPVEELLSRIRGDPCWNRPTTYEETFEPDIPDPANGFVNNQPPSRKRRPRGEEKDGDYVPPTRQIRTNSSRKKQSAIRSSESPEGRDSANSCSLLDAGTLVIESSDTNDTEQEEEVASLHKRRQGRRKESEYLELVVEEIHNYRELYSLDDVYTPDQMDITCKNKWNDVMDIVNISFPQVNPTTAWRSWRKLRRKYLNAASNSPWNIHVCAKKWRAKLLFLDEFVRAPEIRVTNGYLRNEVDDILKSIKRSQAWRQESTESENSLTASNHITKPSRRFNIHAFAKSLEEVVQKYPNLLCEDVRGMQFPKELTPKAHSEWMLVVFEINRWYKSVSESFIWNAWKSHENERWAALQAETSDRSPTLPNIGQESQSSSAATLRASSSTSFEHTIPITTSKAIPRSPEVDSSDGCSSQLISEGAAECETSLAATSNASAEGQARRSSNKLMLRYVAADLTQEIKQHKELAGLDFDELPPPDKWSSDKRAAWNKVVQAVVKKHPIVDEQFLYKALVSSYVIVRGTKKLKDQAKPHSRAAWQSQQRTMVQSHPNIREVSLLHRCGHESLEFLVEQISRYQELYSINTDNASAPNELNQTAKRIWDKIMDALIGKYPDANETLAWKAWRNLRSKYMRNTPPQKWQGRLDFLFSTEGQTNCTVTTGRSFESPSYSESTSSNACVIPETVNSALHDEPEVIQIDDSPPESPSNSRPAPFVPTDIVAPQHTSTCSVVSAPYEQIRVMEQLNEVSSSASPGTSGAAPRQRPPEDGFRDTLKDRWQSVASRSRNKEIDLLQMRRRIIEVISRFDST